MNFAFLLIVVAVVAPHAVVGQGVIDYAALMQQPAEIKKAKGLNKCNSLKDGYGNIYFTDCAYDKNKEMCGKTVEAKEYCCPGFKAIKAGDANCIWRQNLFRPFQDLGSNYIGIEGIDVDPFLTSVGGKLKANEYYDMMMSDGNAFTILAVNNYQENAKLEDIRCQVVGKTREDDQDYEIMQKIKCRNEGSKGSPNMVNYLIGRGRLYTQNMYDGMTFDTWYEGAKWKIQRYGNNIFCIDCAIIQAANYEFNGGIMHVIDRVIVPNKAETTKRQTIMATLRNNDDMRYFADLMTEEMTQFLGTPYCQAWYTVFVPDRGSDGADQLNVLDYVVKNMFCSAAFLGGRQLRTLSGRTIVASCTGAETKTTPTEIPFTIQGGSGQAQVKTGGNRDIVAGNGVIHRIDKVIF